MIDHDKTATQLDRDAKTIKVIQSRFYSSVGAKAACHDIIANLHGLADWHRDQSSANQLELTTDNLLVAAQSQLTKTHAN